MDRKNINPARKRLGAYREPGEMKMAILYGADTVYCV